MNDQRMQSAQELPKPEAWKQENTDPRFLYVAGLQLSIFKEFINIYAPLLYSKQFKDRLKSVPEENKFIKKISFSIDMHKLHIRETRKEKLF